MSRFREKLASIYGVEAYELSRSCLDSMPEERRVRESKWMIENRARYIGCAKACVIAAIDVLRELK